MPITKSVKKALRSSKNKAKRNLAIKNKLKKQIKNVNEKNYSEIISFIDKAAKINFIHKNKAARIKSRLSKKIDLKKIKAKTTKEITNKKTKK